MNEPCSGLIFRIVCFLTSLWQQSSPTVKGRSISACSEWRPLWIWKKYLLQGVCHSWISGNFRQLMITVDSASEWIKTEGCVIDWKMGNFHMWFICSCHCYWWQFFDCLKWSDLVWLQLRMEVYFIAKAVTFKHNLDAVVGLGRPWQSHCSHGNTEFSFRSGPSGTNFILGKCAR